MSVVERAKISITATPTQPRQSKMTQPQPGLYKLQLYWKVEGRPFICSLSVGTPISVAAKEDHPFLTAQASCNTEWTAVPKVEAVRATIVVKKYEP